MDNFVRRQIDLELGSNSLQPILGFHERIKAWRRETGRILTPYVGDLQDYRFTLKMIEDFAPDAIVHFAEQRSAPYSMIDRDHAVFTQINNVVGTLNLLYALAKLRPDCHLVKLGTMGEYGTPNIDIEEGFIEIQHKGRTDVLPFPKQPGSFYHLSKVHDSNNILFAVNNWKLRATDLNQGVVYGVGTEETDLHPDLATRFDYDGVYGTVLNRFCVEAVLGHPITVYGKGGQTRGMLDVKDTVRCIEIACENPPERGDFKVYNQFTEELNVGELAERVHALRPDSVIQHVPNPRTEKAEHYFKAAHTKLIDLGLKPHLLTDDRIREIFKVVEDNRERAQLALVNPNIDWRQTERQEPLWTDLAGEPRPTTVKD